MTGTPSQLVYGVPSIKPKALSIPGKQPTTPHNLCLLSVAQTSLELVILLPQRLKSGVTGLQHPELGKLSLLSHIPVCPEI